MSEETSSQVQDTSSEAVATETATESVESTEATVVNNEGETQSETTYLDGKYKSVSDLEVGYKELQSTFSKKTAEYNKAMGGQTGAPEAYEFAEGVEVSDSIQEYARENNFSNEALNGLVEAYQASQSAKVQEHVAAQKELLGKDAETRLNNVQDWARANGADDATFQSMMTSAKSVEFMESVMKMSQGTAAAPAPASPASHS